MYTLSEALRYEMVFLLSGLIILVGYRLLTNQINIDGLLRDKTGGRAFSSSRLQMLIVTLVIALYYLFMVVDARDMRKMPDMPNEFLLILGGSHIFYLGGKLYGLLANMLGFASPRRMSVLQTIERRTEK